MSILIKDMKMPRNCFLCPLSVMNGERLYCEVTREEVLRAKIAPECPLEEFIERPKGKWIFHGEPPWRVKECSECGEKSHHWSGQLLPNFCPNCGAEMEMEE